MKKEIDQRNYQSKDLTVDILLLDKTSEIKETIIPEVVLVTHDFKELVSYDQRENEVTSNKCTRNKFCEESEDVIVLSYKMRFHVGTNNKLQPTNYDPFNIDVVLNAEKNLRYNKLQPSQYGCPFKLDVIRYPD
ncbi:unnamed protein product [Arabis nemorensis]|uniref:Uncharacterized protein n=1 Tax=Arabis nemorensis TaxID=586526 RepID=A0A565CA31_9BRAS|nr:unnamed protein product [Arabis nemorensis]